MANKVFNLPNMLTYGRIAAVPGVIACFYGDDLMWRWVALGLFTAACITDFFDGYLARVMHQTSNLGRMLDPIADKLLVSACIIMLAYDQTFGPIDMIAALIILTREILVSGMREFLAQLQVSVPVTKLAKWKTTVQMVALGFLLAGEAGEAVLPGSLTIGTILLWTAAILTLYTGYDYIRASARHFVE